MISSNPDLHLRRTSLSLETTNSESQRHGIITHIRDFDPLRPVALHAHLLPGNSGKPSHVSRLIRLITFGVKLRDGSRLRLQAMRGPGGWLSRRCWVMEFIEKITADRMSAIDARIGGAQWAPRGQRTEADRRRAADQAMQAIRELV